MAQVAILKFLQMVEYFFLWAMVPVSILTVTEKQGEDGPLLRPYPDWSWYKDDCNGITGGVYNIEVSIFIFPRRIIHLIVALR